MIHELPSITYNYELDHHLLYLDSTDSGGHGCKDALADVIKRTGLKKHYTHAHEWCCGHGRLGFNILFNNMCDQLTLSDCDYNSIISCEVTTAVNQIDHKVHLFWIDEFSDIPVPAQPWDLIVTNPPFVPDRSFHESKGLCINDRQHVMWVDSEWEAHTNFFKHAKNYITNDCDIYVFGISKFISEQMELAKSHGFKFIQKYDDLRATSPFELLHFRPS